MFPATVYSGARYCLADFTNPTYSIKTDTETLTLTETQLEAKLGVELKGSISNELASDLYHVFDKKNDFGTNFADSLKTIVVFPGCLGIWYKGLAPTRSTIFLADDVSQKNILHELVHVDKYALSDEANAQWRELTSGSHQSPHFYLSYILRNVKSSDHIDCASSGFVTDYASLNTEEDAADLFSDVMCKRTSLRARLLEPTVNRELFAQKLNWGFRHGVINKIHYDRAIDDVWNYVGSDEP